jgi:hypothetical protein
MATSLCPFYRIALVSVERRASARQQTQQLPSLRAPWCAHLFSPVIRYTSTINVGSLRKLSCDGDMRRCQVIASQRPKL